MHDLAAQHPERVRDATEHYQRWASRCGVIREKILALMEAQGETTFWEEEKQK